jgi:hypothetical protein
MKVQTTTDYQTIARLNRTVHDLHARLYPEYFKSYHPNEASNFFKLMMKKEISYSFSWKMGEKLSVMR